MVPVWNFAGLDGGANNYIQNQTGSAQTAGFNVNGNGSLGGTLTVTGTSTLAAINASGAYTQSGAGANTFTGATTVSGALSATAGGTIRGLTVDTATATQDRI